MLRQHRLLQRIVLSAALTSAPLAASLPTVRAAAANGFYPRSIALTTSKAAVSTAFSSAVASDKTYITRLQADPTGGGPLVAHNLLAGFATEAAAIKALPEGTLTVHVPMMLNAASTGYSRFTYDAPTGQTVNQKDPITEFMSPANLYGWYHNGTVRQVHNDILNSPSSAWVDTSGENQFVYMCVDGSCNWVQQTYQVQPPGSYQCLTSPCVFPGPGTNPQSYAEPRFHARLFGSFKADSTGRYFTVADAHHDNFGHTCTDSWTGARDKLSRVFYQQNGALESFVQQITATNDGNAATYQCAYWDGNESAVFYN